MVRSRGGARRLVLRGERVETAAKLRGGLRLTRDYVLKVCQLCPDRAELDEVLASQPPDLPEMLA